ncbi:MAG: ATP-grasp domain-containing protein [Planctomycetaceae bacterium]|nr:ATP-grasp domain-containing protein [Planctomycetaceae bacterium]
MSDSRRILCFEYLQLSDEMFREASASLRSEAGAMLKAILTDALRLQNTEVFTILGHAVSHPMQEADLPGRLTTIRISEVADINRYLQTHGNRFTDVFAIAPECDGVLTDLLARMHSSLPDTVRIHNVPVELSRCFSDKLSTTQWCNEHRLPCIPASPCSRRIADLLRDRFLTGTPSSRSERPAGAVLKPRYGAGSQDVCRLSCEWDELSRLISDTDDAVPEDQDWIVQPWIAGISCSVGFLGNVSQECPAVVLPPVRQQIRDISGRLQYTGGELRIPDPGLDAAERLAVRFGEVVGPFAGYLGIDMIASTDSFDSEAVIVEINPRLCTSYVGYQTLCTASLFAAMVATETHHRELAWRRHVHRFAPGTDP